MTHESKICCRKDLSNLYLALSILSYTPPTNAFPVEIGLWKQFLQDRQIHAEHSSELLVGGVVVEVHMTGGVDLLLGAKL